MVQETIPKWQELINEGNEACQKSNFHEALKFYKSALETAHQENIDEAFFGHIFYLIGFCNHALGQFSDAEQSYKQSIATLERAEGDPEEIAEVLDHYSRLCADTGRIEEAKKYEIQKNNLLKSPQDSSKEKEKAAEEDKPEKLKDSKSRYASAIDEEHNQSIKSADQDDPDVSKSLLDMSLNDSLDEALDESIQQMPNNVETSFNNESADDQTSTSLDKVPPGPLRLTKSAPDKPDKTEDKPKKTKKESGKKTDSKSNAKQQKDSNNRDGEKSSKADKKADADKDHSNVVRIKATPNSSSQDSSNIVQINPTPGSSSPAKTKENSTSKAEDKPDKEQKPVKLKKRSPGILRQEEEISYDEAVSEDSETPAILNEMELNSLIHPRERVYKVLSFIFTGWVYLLLTISTIIFLIGPVVLLLAYIGNGLFLGSLRGSGIKVSHEQFPEVNKLIEEYCTVLRMEVPETIIINQGGWLNAFASRLLRKDILVIYADVLELAYEKGEKELAFVICHELAHIKLGHARWHWAHIPGSFVPFFGTAYSRACEYTCDRIARKIVPDGALYGLVALTAGNKLYKRVNLSALYEQQEKDWDFWTWFHEIKSTHPNLINRIKAIGIAEAEAKARMGKPE